MVFKSRDWNTISEQLKNCMLDISAWMTLNMLKLNQEKTELIVFSPKQRGKTVLSSE